MRLESKDMVSAPVDVVYRLVRDDMPKLIPHLPNIARIERLERNEPAPGRVEIVNHWFAKGELPAVARKLVSPDLLSWKDIASWNDEIRVVEYRLESFVARGLFEVRGRTRFSAVGTDQTEVAVECDLEIHPERLPGVPKFLASRAKPLAEEVIGGFLLPNLKGLAAGLNRYFDV